jgi:hypothetical protein
MIASASQEIRASGSRSPRIPGRRNTGRPLSSGAGDPGARTGQPQEQHEVDQQYDRRGEQREIAPPALPHRVRGQLANQGGAAVPAERSRRRPELHDDDHAAVPPSGRLQRRRRPAVPAGQTRSHRWVRRGGLRCVLVRCVLLWCWRRRVTGRRRIAGRRGRIGRRRRRWRVLTRRVLSWRVLTRRERWRRVLRWWRVLRRWRVLRWWRVLRRRVLGRRVSRRRIGLAGVAHGDPPRSMRDTE